MREVMIAASHLKKSFKVYHDKGRSLKEKLLFQNRNAYERRQVLKDVSFTVQKGDVVAVIGKNGCGKSTLLKLLTRIMYPDSGQITLGGRVSSLIELGAGFHPDMTGRENIYLNAAIFGLTRKKIDERLDDIIAFSELAEYIDAPVRTYSSGMYARLAFSVAIHVSAQILLVDEILSVGDAAFQHKCFEKMRMLQQAGTTIVIVSHDLGQAARLCGRVIWIEEGLIRMDGPPRPVIDAYLHAMGQPGLGEERP